MTLRLNLVSVCGLFLLSACPSGGGETTGSESDTEGTTAGTTADDSTGGTTGGTTDEPTSSTTAGTSTGGAAVSFAAVQEIFTSACNCHQTPPNPGNGMLELTPGNAHANLVGVKSSQAAGTNRVEPGDPSKSYLWLKLTGDYLSVTGGTGDPMPLGGSLTPEQMTTIEEWILAGAPAE